MSTCGRLRPVTPLKIAPIERLLCAQEQPVNVSNDVLVVGNRISSAKYGIYYDGGSGKYMDNLTSGITTTAFIGGTAVGTNN